MIPLDHRDTGSEADPYTEPNSYFSDSSHSLNSLNSMKVLLHLEKTPMCLKELRIEYSNFHNYQQMIFQLHLGGASNGQLDEKFHSE